MNFKTPSKTELEAYVEAASITTDNEKRDKHLRSADFFNAPAPDDKFTPPRDSKGLLITTAKADGTFPIIALKSKSIKKLTSNTFQMVTDFTMKGVTKPVTFDVTYKGSADSGGKSRVYFEAKGELNRQDFGVSFSTLQDSLPLVGDEVKIMIAVQGFKVSE